MRRPLDVDELIAALRRRARDRHEMANCESHWGYRGQYRGAAIAIEVIADAIDEATRDAPETKEPAP